MKNLRQHWEKLTKRGVRYDEIQEQQDFVGAMDRNAALSQTRRMLCLSYPVSLSQ